MATNMATAPTSAPITPTAPSVPQGKLTPQQIAQARSSLTASPNNGQPDSFGIDAPQAPQSFGQKYENFSNSLGNFAENAVGTAGGNFLLDVGQTAAMHTPEGQKIQQQVNQSNQSQSNGDLAYLKALQNNLQQAQSTKNTARVQQLQTALQNFHLSNGTKLSDVFPILNKSDEQITGDTIGAMTTALTAGLGNVPVPASILGRVGLGALEGAGIGGSYGAGGAMSQNASAKDVVKSAATNAVIGGAGGALIAGAPDALSSFRDTVQGVPATQLQSETSNVINNHYISAQQVLDDTELKAAPADVLEHAKNNIVGSLQADGQNELATRISKIDTTDMSTIGDLKSQIDSKIQGQPGIFSNQGASPEETPPTQKVTPEQQAVSQSQNDVKQATQARKGASSQAVQGVKDINTKVSAYKSSLGDQFASDAQELEKASPDKKLNLTNDEVKGLNSLKESKNFVLPKSLDQSENAVSMKGNEVNLGPNVRSQLESELGKAGAANAVELSPTETQDLLRELNRSTYKQMPDGTFQVDQQRIGITNDIKNAASEAFGKPWDDIYSRYAAGRAAIDKIDSFVNLDPRATAADFNKQLETILKQSKTPEGKLLLQQSVNEYKTETGVNLSDPIKAVQQIADKQTALDAANENLTQAQKDLFKAQREADIQKIKGGYLKRLVTSSVSPEKMGGRLAWGVLGIGIIYPLIRAIQKAL